MKIKKIKARGQSDDKQAYWAEKDERISRQWAINAAMEYLAHATTKAKQFNLDEIQIVAKQMLHLRDNLNAPQREETMQF